jgi:ABC-type phosphate/phosphonate transport system substrate-binding protein
MKRNVEKIILIVICFCFSQSLFATEFKVAVRAHHGIDVADKQWQPTLDTLTRQLPSHSFTLIPIVSLNEITQRAGKGEFDFVLTNPSSFVEIKQLYGAKALVTLNNKRANTAQDRFGSVIFTHVNNGDILTLKDLKGKILMAVSEPAFGGWRVAWLEMLEQGFNPHEQLKQLMFTMTKTQPEVVREVLDGKVDAGVVRTDLLERLEAAGKIDMRYLRILNNKEAKGFPFFLSTKLYPEWSFVTLKSVPTELAQQVKRTLLAITSDSTAAQAGKYVGWVPPLDYSPVQNLMKKLKVGPYARQK